MIPSEYSSGGQQRLGAMSKQGNALLRYLWCEAVLHTKNNFPRTFSFPSHLVGFAFPMAIPPQAVPLKKARGWLALFLFVAITVLLYFAMRGMERDSHLPKPHGYTLNICQDQKDTEMNLSTLTSDSFDYDLLSGCFGGWVELPTAWRSQRIQFLGNDKTYWVAIWWQGKGSPWGPYMYDDLMSRAQNYQSPSRSFRLQGKGRLRFYRTQ